MNIKIPPQAGTEKIGGNVKAPVSKSDAHRLLICAALGDKPCRIILGNDFCDDISATIDCLEALGVGMTVDTENGCVSVAPPARFTNGASLFFRESGSTARFLVPVAAALTDGFSMSGSGRLPLRPHTELFKVLAAHGVDFSSVALPSNAKGRLSGGEFVLQGDISSQYISGLLMALPLINEDCTLRLSTPLASAPYVDMTLCTMERFGIKPHISGREYRVEKGSSYKTPQGSMTAQGDWSSSAFLFAIAAMAGSVCVSGLDINSPQGDREILTVLLKMGADIEIGSHGITVRKSALRPIELNAENIPDLVPIIACLCSCSDSGQSVITGTSRLRLKESDRIESTVAMINSLGGNASVRGDDIVVYGTSGFKGGIPETYGDHRIVMSCAAASVRSSGDILIRSIESADKSYPGFFCDFTKLGGRFDVL